MLTANAGPCGPGTQAAVEKIGYGLAAKGMAIDSASALVASYPGVAKVNDYPDVFGTLAVLAGKMATRRKCLTCSWCLQLCLQGIV